MPTPHHLRNLAVPANRHTLADAARQSLLVSVRCKRCRREPVVFLASDLVQVLDPNRDTSLPPFPCSRCGRDEYIEVKLRLPDEASVGKLVVRRLVGIKHVPTWANELLGDRPA